MNQQKQISAEEYTRTQRIAELRNQYQSISDPSEEFKKSIQKQCDNHGIDIYLVVCTNDQLGTVKSKGNINAF